MEVIKKTAGFTLIELLVAMAITSMLIAVVALAYTTQSRSYNSLQDVNSLQQEMRSALDLVAKDIRMAGYNPTGNANGATIVKATSSEFQFTQDITNNAGTGLSDGDIDDPNEDIRFAINTNGSFGRETDDISGLQPIAENIDRLEFDYLLDTGKWTQTPDPANLKKIYAVKVILLGHSAHESGSVDTSTFNASFGSPREDIVTNDWTPASPGKHHWRLVSTVVQCRNMQIKN